MSRRLAIAIFVVFGAVFMAATAIGAKTLQSTKVVEKKVRIATPMKVSKMTTVQLATQLGKPYAGVNCKVLLGLTKMVGYLWVDEKNARVVVVCGPKA